MPGFPFWGASASFPRGLTRGHGIGVLELCPLRQGNVGKLGDGARVDSTTPAMVVQEETLRNHVCLGPL